MKKALTIFSAAAILIALLLGCAQTPVAEKPPETTDAPAIDYAINGVALGEYAIVYSDDDTDYARRAAAYIRDAIKTRTGLELPLQEDDRVTADYEIVVGNTQREISALLETPADPNCFAYLSAGNQVAMEGEYFLIAAAAYYFVQTYIPEGFFDSRIPAETTVCQPITEKPNRYILLIGDGMGVNHTKLYENPPLQLQQLTGLSDGEDVFYGYLLPNQGFARTDSLSGVTDSAAAGTALATGYKTYNDRLGLDGNGKPVRNLTEIANYLGKSTAVMSTEVRTGATPSAFLVHIPNRNQTEAILQAQKNIEKIGVQIVCGFDVYQPEQIEPQIEDAVLGVLAQLEQDPEGFFFVYEEAYIDKHSHNNDICWAFLALSRFNQVIGRVMEYAYYHPDTFVLITADHETGGLTPDENGTMQYHTGNHTGADVPVFAWGQGSELFNGQTVENTQIPKTIARMWGMEDFGDPNTEPALG